MLLLLLRGGRGWRSFSLRSENGLGCSGYCGSRSSGPRGGRRCLGIGSGLNTSPSRSDGLGGGRRRYWRSSIRIRIRSIELINAVLMGTVMFRPCPGSSMGILAVSISPSIQAEFLRNRKCRLTTSANSFQLADFTTPSLSRMARAN